MPVAAAVAVATIASKLMITGNLWLGIMFGLVCAGQTLLTAWLIEHWFGRAFKLEDVPQVLGFLVASAVGAAMAAVGVVAAVSLVVQLTAPPLDVWRHWFASCLLGTVTVAPLLIGLGEAVRELPPRRELIEGGGRRRDPGCAECIRHFPATGILDNGLTRGPRVSPPVMDRRTLPAGVRSCRDVCRVLSRHLVDNLRLGALRRRKHSSCRPHTRCANLRIGRGIVDLRSRRAFRREAPE